MVTNLPLALPLAPVTCYLGTEEGPGVSNVGHIQPIPIDESCHHCGTALDEIVKTANLGYLSGEESSSNAGISLGSFLLQ